MAIAGSERQDGPVDDPRPPEQRAPVAVAVSPRLLSDTVRRTLELDGVPSTEVPEGSAVNCDVAVVSAGRERDVHARTVIRLAGDPETAGPADVLDLEGLRAVLADVRPRHQE